MLCFQQLEPKGLGNKRQKWNHLLSPSLLVTDLQTLWSSSIQLLALLIRGPGSWAGTPGIRGHSKGSTEPEGLTTSWSLRLVLVIDEQRKEPSHSTGRNGQPWLSWDPRVAAYNSVKQVYLEPADSLGHLMMIVSGDNNEYRLKVVQPAKGLDIQEWRCDPCTKQETSQMKCPLRIRVI